MADHAVRAVPFEEVADGATPTNKGKVLGAVDGRPFEIAARFDSRELFEHDVGVACAAEVGAESAQACLHIVAALGGDVVAQHFQGDSQAAGADADLVHTAAVIPAGRGSSVDVRSPLCEHADEQLCRALVGACRCARLRAVADEPAKVLHAHVGRHDAAFDQPSHRAARARDWITDADQLGGPVGEVDQRERRARVAGAGVSDAPAVDDEAIVDSPHETMVAVSQCDDRRVGARDGRTNDVVRRASRHALDGVPRAAVRDE